MQFQSVKAETLKTAELTGLVKRAQRMTKGSYDLYDQNYESLTALLKRILKLSKEAKEWYLYFDAIYELLYLHKRDNNYAEIVKLAEVYYKDSALYMDREIPNYPGMDMGLLNVYIYDNIFEAYYHYHQIDDAKMELFMKQYEEVVHKYGLHFFYYISEMELGSLYHDAERAKRAAGNFLKYEKNISSCYVCRHMAYLDHFLLNGQDAQAEEFMEKMVHKNIPKQHLWCYNYCQNADPASMYAHVLYQCIWYGRKDAFDYFYQKFWKVMPHEAQWTEGSDTCVIIRVLSAYSGDFAELEDDLREVTEDIEKEKKQTTVTTMEFALEWWMYFSLLDRSGIHEVKLSLPGLETKEGMAAAMAVSEFMERRADEFGRKFAQSRVRFDYEFVKESFRKCLESGIGG